MDNVSNQPSVIDTGGRDGAQAVPCAQRRESEHDRADAARATASGGPTTAPGICGSQAYGDGRGVADAAIARVPQQREHFGRSLDDQAVAAMLTGRNGVLTVDEAAALARRVTRVAARLGSSVAPPAAFFESAEARAAMARRDVHEVFEVLSAMGLSQRRIAALTGQSQSEISEIKALRRVRSIDVIERIADGLGTPRSWWGLALSELPAVDDSTERFRVADMVEVAGEVQLAALQLANLAERLQTIVSADE